jgi:hypothetical protein
MRVKMILPALTEATSPLFRPIKYSLFPPLGLATLAGYLDDRDEVTLVDEHVETARTDDEPDLVVIQGAGGGLLAGVPGLLPVEIDMEGCPRQADTAGAGPACGVLRGVEEVRAAVGPGDPRRSGRKGPATPGGILSRPSRATAPSRGTTRSAAVEKSGAA